MSTYADIYGHNDIKEHLQKCIELKKVSHAYIFNGSLGAGKKTIAALFAKALQCEEGKAQPCGKCHSCIQADSKNQPDIIWVGHEKVSSIGVDDIRQQLVGDIQIKPYYSRYKIYIIDEAEKLTVQAQNTLLKTIEEPPEYGIIILLTTNADIFLQTVLSRCVRIDFKPISDDLVEQFIKEHYVISNYEVQFATAFAQGNIGRAITAIDSQDFGKLKESVLNVVKHAKEMSTTQILAEVKNIMSYKNSIDDYLDLIAMWYRDVLLFKSTNNANKVIFKEELFLIKAHSSEYSYMGLEDILNAIDKVKIRLKANVKFDLTIELMIMTIKDAM